MSPDPALINDILNEEPCAEEKAMLAGFAGVRSLVSRDEALALYRIAKLLPPEKRILEIGPYRGGSTVALGHAAVERNLRMYCVDLWADYEIQPAFSNVDSSLLQGDQILAEFMANTRFLKDRIFMLRGDAGGFFDIMAPKSFSLVFIDGAHDYFSVVDDIVLALKVVEPGGIICGHDYHSAGTDVIKAVHDTIMNSEMIDVKGLVKNTSIWFSQIKDPDYEYLVAKTVRCLAKNDYQAAYEVLAGGMSSVTRSRELEALHTSLRTQLGLER